MKFPAFEDEISCFEPEFEPHDLQISTGFATLYPHTRDRKHGEKGVKRNKAGNK